MDKHHPTPSPANAAKVLAFHSLWKRVGVRAGLKERQLPWLALSTIAIFFAGCAGDPQRLPAPVEQRSPGSPAIATPAPGVARSTTPAAPTTPEAPPQRDATIDALVTKANDQATEGQYQAAAGSLERAIRIAPDDPELWYQLARIRLRQGELVEAEELAGKSRNMAGGQPLLQARNWRLVAVVRRQRGDDTGAQQALETAKNLENGKR